MVKGNLLAGILALTLFGYAQYAGWNLFDKEASSQGTRSTGSRISHK